MKILITGATGFIGSNMVKKLIGNGETIFCTLLDGETNPFGNNVKAFYLADNKENELVQFIKENKIEGVIHLAAYVLSGKHDIQDIKKLIDSNVKFGVIILDSAVNGGVKWFINTGTYWQNYNNSDYSPVNLYAATKQAFESIAQLYIDSKKINYCSIKLFDTYGPNDTRPKIFKLWERIVKTGESLEMSPGDQIIDISYIDDIVNAYIMLAKSMQTNEAEVINGARYAVRAEKRYTLKELASIFQKITNSKLNIVWGALPYRDREILVPCISDDLVPGWKPLVSIEEGIRKMVSLSNQGDISE